MKNLINAALLTVLAVTFAPASPVTAQDATDAAPAPETELRELAAEEGPMDRAREVLHDFLDQPGVADAAEGIGVDVERLQDGVNTLSDTEASELAERVQDSQDQEPMAGGDTFVITSTTIVIILLVAILIAVA